MNTMTDAASNKMTYVAFKNTKLPDNNYDDTIVCVSYQIEECIYAAHKDMVSNPDPTKLWYIAGYSLPATPDDALTAYTAFATKDDFKLSTPAYYFSLPGIEVDFAAL